MRWPCGVAISPRSSSNCMTIAVEVRTKPAPATNDWATGKPVAMPTPVRSSAQTPTCRAPRPKMLLAQSPQPGWLHFEADEKQKHHNAEFRDMQNRLRVGEEFEAKRAYHETGREIT